MFFSRFSSGSSVFKLALVACFASPAAANDVAVYGNHVYADDVILKEGGIGYGAPPPPATEIRRRLLSTGFFSRVRVLERNDVTEISVVEKMPAFVLPYFSSSSQRKVFGVAGGIVGSDEGASQILARYQLGTGDHAGGAFYRKDFAFDSLAIVTATLEYESALHDVYVGRDVARSFDNWQVNGEFGLGWHFSPNLLFELDHHVELHRFVDVDGREIRGTQVSHRLFGELGTLYSDEGLESGGKAKPYVELSNPLGSFSFVQWGLLAEGSAFRRGDLNWIVRPKWEAGVGLPRYQLFELGGPKLRGYSFQTFRTDHYFAVQNDFVPVALRLGNALTMRPFAFADWAYIDDGGRTGAGVGVRLFFRHVAVPALEISGGYGFRPAGFSIAAAVGPAF